MEAGSAISSASKHFSQRSVNEFTCARCGGFMVGEYCLDLPNGTGELEFLAARCVQCGEVIDPVILKNRRVQRPSSASSLFGSVGTHL